MKYTTILLAAACLSLQGCQTPEQIAAQKAQQQQAAIAAAASLDEQLHDYCVNRSLSAATAKGGFKECMKDMNARLLQQEEQQRRDAQIKAARQRQASDNFMRLQMQQQQQQQQEIDRMNAYRPKTTNCMPNGVGGIVCTSQ